MIEVGIEKKKEDPMHITRCALRICASSLHRGAETFQTPLKKMMFDG